MTNKPRFDQLANSYDELLRDPVRDRFSGKESLFFHRRKCELIRNFFRNRKVDTSSFRYLDVGCGRGELLRLLQSDFRQGAGCDVSAGMMQHVTGFETRVQDTPSSIPFPDATFDFVTAVCVYHHVPRGVRPGLTSEISRVLRPGGIFCMIEHNPLNPVTRLIVSSTPVDSDAVLLNAREGRELAANAGLRVVSQQYFLYFPQVLYSHLAGIEALMKRIPFGGQYALFSSRP